MTRPLSILFLLLLTSSLTAQWTVVQTNIPDDLLDLSHSNGHWVAGIYGGVAYSADNGGTWAIREFRDPNTNINLANGIRCVRLTAPQQGLASGRLLMGNAQATVSTTTGFQTFTPTYGNNGGGWPRDVNDWFFPSNSLGFACGSNFSLLKTTNGGSTWSAVTATTAPLYGIDFWNNQTGLAVGAGVALRTTNGGSSWQSTSVKNDLLGVSMASEQVAYAITDQEVYRTDDSGSTWSATSPPPFQILSGFRCVQAIDEQTLLVGTVGGILMSTDGGHSWSVFRETQIILPDSTAYIGVNNFYRKNNEWWAACDRGVLMKATQLDGAKPLALSKITQTGGGCSPLQITATAWVNDKWQYTWWLGNKNLGQVNPLSLTFTQTVSDVLRLVVSNGTSQDTATFPIQAEVLAYIPPVIPAEVNTCSGSVLRFEPTDGYNFFWEPTNLFHDPTAQNAVFTGTASATVIAYYAVGGCLASDTVRINVLNDRPLEFWQPTVPSGLNWPVSSLDFVDSLRGFAIESDGSRLLRTVDGGKNWIISGPFAYQRFYNDVDFVTPSVGYAVSAVVYRTTDGGASWQQVLSDQFVNAEFRNVHFLDEKQGLALAHGSTSNFFRIVRTEDGGQTWQIVYSDYAFGTSMGVKCPTPTRCYCIGSNGLGGFVLRSDDAGTTWASVLQKPVPDGLGNFDFIGQDSLIAMDNSMRLFFSYDGGQNWTPPVSFNTGGILNYSPSSVGMVNRKEGYIGLPNGVVIKTFDGGQCWYKLGAAETSGTYALDFAFPTARHRFYAGGGSAFMSGQIWRLDSVGMVSQAEPALQRILLMPNPVHSAGQVTALGTGQLEIWDMSGRLAARFDLTEPNSPLALPPLTAGLYLVRLQERGRSWTEKLMVLP